MTAPTFSSTFANRAVFSSIAYLTSCTESRGKMVTRTYQSPKHIGVGCGRLTKTSDYKDMGDQWAKKAKDLTSVYRWFW
jgi:hypothetical protein